MPEIIIALTDADIAHAIRLADARNTRSRRRGDPNKYYRETETSSVREHRTGALGECAVAKWLELPLPTSVDTFKREPDLPPDIEVRTRRKRSYELLVRPTDPPDRRYVLVLAESSRYVLRGWMFGKEAMRAEWLKPYGGGKPAHFVPFHYLYDITYFCRSRSIAEIRRHAKSRPATRGDICDIGRACFNIRYDERGHAE